MVTEMSKQEWLQQEQERVNCLNGLKCVYCGYRFKEKDYTHPTEMELVNGYPDICRRTGFVVGPHRINDDEDYWLVYDPTYLLDLADRGYKRLAARLAGFDYDSEVSLMVTK